MKKRKSFTARFAAFVLISILGFTLPENIHASGYPVFDITAMLNALEQIYQTYDEINSMIEQVENGYKQIEQGINMVKSFNFEEMSLENWSSEGGIKGAWENIGKSRTRLRQAGGYVSQKQEEMEAIKNKLNSDIISWNGTNYSIQDLVGLGDDPSKDISGLAHNIASFAMERYESSAEAFENGMTEKERRDVWKYYGVSPAVFRMGQHINGLAEGMIDGSLGAMSKNFDKVQNDATEKDIQEILAMADAAAGSDSTVQHQQVLQETEFKIYSKLGDMAGTIKKLLATQSYKEYQEMYNREVEERKKKQAAINDWVELRTDMRNTKQAGL